MAQTTLLATEAKSRWWLKNNESVLTFCTEVPASHVQHCYADAEHLQPLDFDEAHQSEEEPLDDREFRQQFNDDPLWYTAV